MKYTIHKLVEVESLNHKRKGIEQIDGVCGVLALKEGATLAFETIPVPCIKASGTCGQTHSSSAQETILGVVVTLSTGGNVILTQRQPIDLNKRIEKEKEKHYSLTLIEERKREADRRAGIRALPKK